MGMKICTGTKKTGEVNLLDLSKEQLIEFCIKQGEQIKILLATIETLENTLHIGMDIYNGKTKKLDEEFIQTANKGDVCLN